MYIYLYIYTYIRICVTVIENLVIACHLFGDSSKTGQSKIRIIEFIAHDAFAC